MRSIISITANQYLKISGWPILPPVLINFINYANSFTEYGVYLLDHFKVQGNVEPFFVIILKNLKKDKFLNIFQGAFYE